MFVQSLGEAWSSWGKYVAYVFLYSGAVVGLATIMSYFFGKRAGIITTKVVGFPFWAIYLVVEQISHIVYWPWHYRQNRLLREIFEIETPTQSKVDEVLGQKAWDLKMLFQQQEEERKAKNDTGQHNASIRTFKKDFWLAHSVARKANYGVLPRLTDYWTDYYFHFYLPNKG